MARESQQSIADRLSPEMGFKVTRDMVRQWQKKEYDLDDIDSLKESLLEQERQPIGMEVEEFEVVAVSVTGVESEIAELRKQLLGAKDKKTAETIKIKILGLGSIQRMLITQGEYIKTSDAQSAGQAAGYQSRAAWEKIVSDLPPMMEGLTALQMESKLREYSRQRCEELCAVFIQ